jgi:hypothetical protein
MQVVHPICCGIDVHQAPLTACLRCVSDEGQITTELRDFGTTYGEFLAQSDHRAVLVDEPVGQGEKRRIGRGKLTPFFTHLTVGVHAAQTCGEHVLVDVDTTTDGMFYLHRCTLLRFVRPTTDRDGGAPATRGLFLRVIDDLDWWGCRTPDRPI